MAHEVNRNGRYYCDRLGAACDFRILDLPKDVLVDWIVTQGLPFDSLHFYEVNRPVHISYGPQHKRDIWAFTEQGTPTRYRPFRRFHRAQIGLGSTALSDAFARWMHPHTVVDDDKADSYILRW